MHRLPERLPAVGDAVGHGHLPLPQLQQQLVDLAHVLQDVEGGRHGVRKLGGWIVGAGKGAVTVVRRQWRGRGQQLAQFPDRQLCRAIRRRRCRRRRCVDGILHTLHAQHAGQQLVGARQLGAHHRRQVAQPPAPHEGRHRALAGHALQGAHIDLGAQRMALAVRLGALRGPQQRLELQQLRLHRLVQPLRGAHQVRVVLQLFVAEEGECVEARARPAVVGDGLRHFGQQRGRKGLGKGVLLHARHRHRFHQVAALHRIADGGRVLRQLPERARQRRLHQCGPLRRGLLDAGAVDGLVLRWLRWAGHRR